MILSGHDFLELRHPMLIRNLANIERIGGSERVTAYRASIKTLEEQVQVLKTLCQANVVTIVEIEVVRL